MNISNARPNALYLWRKKNTELYKHRIVAQVNTIKEKLRFMFERCHIGIMVQNTLKDHAKAVHVVR